MEDKKQRIRELLTDALPSVNLDSDFLFSELDSIGVVTVTVILSNEYGIELDSSDITPKNFMNLDSIASMGIPRDPFRCKSCSFLLRRNRTCLHLLHQYRIRIYILCGE